MRLAPTSLPNAGSRPKAARIRLLAAGATGLMLAGALVVPSPAAAVSPTDKTTAGTAIGAATTSIDAAGTADAAAAGAYARTSWVERRRVDSVATPKLRWYSCYSWAQCATAQVPLDYDRPNGAKTTLALLRVKARDQKNKIGSLFLNPGGPGGSGVAIALAAPYFLSDPLLERFDIVGMDPRGVGFSDPVACFTDAGRQQPVLSKINTGFPYGKKEEKAFIKASAAQGRACSTTGRMLAGSMSTAEVARDMDVIRRAVGDRKLSYLGFSYGTALGQYYANMFPDRFRAIAVDGVINPVAWVGAKSNAVQDDRLRSADGAWRALHEILDRCNTAGATKCEFSGQAIRRFRVLTDRLKAKPLSVDGQKITYSMFVSMVLSALYDVHAGAEVTALAAAVWRLTTPGASRGESVAAQATVTRFASRAFPYDNSFDAYTAVMCTDGRHPANSAAWVKAGAKADKRAPYFGRAWAWSSVSCARNTWTVRDEDAYTGPFNRKTKNPVLFVGNYWDPATNYADAVSSSKLLPNSRLLSSTNWGHTAYGTSPCVTTAMDRYLLSRTLPTKGTTCVGTAQPFRTVLSDDPDELAKDTFDLNTATLVEIAAHGLPAENTPKHLPPVR
ncbi:alpha/beta hydrolase [Actinoplanes sp. TRM 88003]|uniref:Alpha/beta hydrolase n=1 Tax=Paractinoplanes aksuensis TaxID=2939490 RepID=A0ABT1DMH8_9ACTN|nr:alpha/beta hydrolase [Actinoplanes aksuensis]MCO8271296.1 alpha/beta hydrolase [Actinoplanes aksuensis]